MKKYKYTKSFTFDGKRYKVYADKESDLYMKMANKIRDLEEGKIIISSNMTVSEWAETAINTYKTGQKNNTRRKFEYLVKATILDEIGYMPLKTVKPIICQNVLNLQSGKSEYYIKQVRRALNFIFETAVNNKLILENPARVLTLPLGEKEKTGRQITADERKHALSVFKLDDRFKLFELMLYCGCRPSEAAECKGSDISTKDGFPILHIRGTKTVNSDRFVPIGSEFYERIKDTPQDVYIAHTSTGYKITDSNRRNLIRRFKREMNISMGCKVYRNELIPPFPLAEDFKIYFFRHTFCTDLQKKGVDIRTAQYLMGHSDIQTTVNIYTHTDDELLLEAAKKMVQKEA